MKGNGSRETQPRSVCVGLQNKFCTARPEDTNDPARRLVRFAAVSLADYTATPAAPSDRRWSADYRPRAGSAIAAQLKLSDGSAIDRSCHYPGARRKHREVGGARGPLRSEECSGVQDIDVVVVIPHAKRCRRGHQTRHHPLKMACRTRPAEGPLPGAYG